MRQITESGGNKKLLLTCDHPGCSSKLTITLVEGKRWERIAKFHRWFNTESSDRCGNHFSQVKE